MLVDSLYFSLRPDWRFNSCSILKAFARQLWVRPVHMQFKHKLGTGIVSYTVLRHSLLNLTSFQVFSSALCPTEASFPNSSVRKVRPLFRVLPAHRISPVAEQFCMRGLPLGQSHKTKEGKKQNTHSQMCCFFKF